MRSNIKSKRIGNLEFGMSSYLLPESALPEHIGFSINKYYQNPYYGKENEYKKEGEFYIKSDEEYGCKTRIHENCFKYAESRYVIASWDWDDKDCYYNFEFIGDRPLQLNEDERKVFWKLIEFGFDLLCGGESENERKIRQFWKHPFRYDGFGNIVDATGTVLVFSFKLNTLIKDDFIENMVCLLNGDKEAVALPYFTISNDGELSACKLESEDMLYLGKFRGYENVEEYYKYSEESCAAWDVWQAFLGFCDNRLKKEQL